MGKINSIALSASENSVGYFRKSCKSGNEIGLRPLAEEGDDEGRKL